MLALRIFWPLHSRRNEAGTTLDELIPVGGDSEKNSRFDTLWEAENFVLNKTKGGELLVRVYCETGDTRTAKIESFFSGLFSCGAPTARA